MYLRGMVQSASTPIRSITSSPLRVELVHIRNFRGLSDVILTLDPGLTLLIGRNSSGKSRLLRAVAIACGSLTASSDDFSVNGHENPQIDLVLAPADTKDEAEFEKSVLAVFGTAVQPTSAIGRDRIAWRTTVTRSAEGWGAKSNSEFLTFDISDSTWKTAQNSASPSTAQRRMVAADLVETGRDLAAELTRQGSAVRRVLDQLEIAESERQGLEKDLLDLGSRIVDNSGTLSSVRDRLAQLSDAIAGVGQPHVRALPTRLEELVRMIDIALDTGNGGLPMRLHGSGARSLGSLQIQGVLYDRRLGRDGSDTPRHPVTLIEEPEAHLHPQACLQLVKLLHAIPGQVIASTHSSHLVTAAPVTSLRMVRSVNGSTSVTDFTPIDKATTTPPALRIDVGAVEWEKIHKYVERPFGEVVFAETMIIGDGASERAFLPELLSHALGNTAAGICVVDPGSMSQALPLAKYAEAAGMRCIAFVDCDTAGRRDADKFGDYVSRVYCTGNRDSDGALEEVLVGFDEQWVTKECQRLFPSGVGTALQQVKNLKGTYGASLGRSFVLKYPNTANWPLGFRQLLSALDTSGGGGDE